MARRIPRRSVDEAGQMVGTRMGEAHARGQPEPLALIAHRGGKRPRVLEVLVEHEDVRAGRGRRGRREQLAVVRRRTQYPRQRAVPEQRLSPRAVGASGARQVEPRDARIVEAGVGPDDLLPVALQIVREAEPRLEHLVVAGNRAVAGELEGADRVRHRLADERRVEQPVDRGDQAGARSAPPSGARS